MDQDQHKYGERVSQKQLNLQTRRYRCHPPKHVGKIVDIVHGMCKPLQALIQEMKIVSQHIQGLIPRQ